MDDKAGLREMLEKTALPVEWWYALQMTENHETLLNGVTAAERAYAQRFGNHPVECPRAAIYGKTLMLAYPLPGQAAQG